MGVINEMWTEYSSTPDVHDYLGQDTSLCMSPRVPAESCTVRYPGHCVLWSMLTQILADSCAYVHQCYDYRF